MKETPAAESEPKEIRGGRVCILMRTSSRAELGTKLRRDPRRCVAAVRRCGHWWVVAIALAGLGPAGNGQNATGGEETLPDAPGALMSQSGVAEGQSQVSPSDTSGKDAEGVAAVTPMRPCKDSDYTMDKVPLQGPPPCIPEDPIQPFVT